ncbi:MAG: serine/threonine-protein kinase, partial [Vicinamibacterales bacterium]
MSSLSDEAVERLRVAAHWPEFRSARYSVTGEIGHGGMGTVYAAVDETLGREVAVKVSNAVEGPTSEDRLSTESRVLARLEHPGIVPVHDAGYLLDGRRYYVMKRVHGRTLTEHLRDESDLSERLRIFERVCEATAFAHARRILHRDLKPDNVMIGAFGEVMVMDWGVAKALDHDDHNVAERNTFRLAVPDTALGGTDQGTILGTHGYMAPEQARGDTGNLDERADVYSLGAILLTLLAGQETPAHRGGSVSHSRRIDGHDLGTGGCPSNRGDRDRFHVEGRPCGRADRLVRQEGAIARGGAGSRSFGRSLPGVFGGSHTPALRGALLVA